jgi:hypothetical protein
MIQKAPHLSTLIMISYSPKTLQWGWEVARGAPSLQVASGAPAQSSAAARCCWRRGPGYSPLKMWPLEKSRRRSGRSPQGTASLRPTTVTEAAASTDSPYLRAVREQRLVQTLQEISSLEEDIPI